MSDQNTGSFIGLEEAVEMTRTYQENHAGETKAVFYGISKIRELMAIRDDVMGVRAYFATDADGNHTLVVAAVDSDGRDIVNANANVLLDFGDRCPMKCDNESPLNHNNSH